MRKLLNRYPNLSSYLLAVLLFGAALIMSGLINKGVIKAYFPFAAIILLYLATWVLYRREHKSLASIGLNFSLRNVAFLPLGIFMGAIAFLGSKFLRALYLGENIEISPAVDYSTLLLAFYFILPQVTTEELLFRGYLFDKTVSLTNAVVANVIFSILFMLVHVLDEHALNSRGTMIFLAISIPVGHLLFATALLKSKTLFFPIGLHLGNNWATRHLITDSQTEASLLYVEHTTTFESWTPFLMMIFITNGYFLLITLLIWKWDRFVGWFKGK